MTKKIKLVFVVFGATGEYSDHQEWAVMAYTDEAQAQVHIDLASAWVRENIGDYPGYGRQNAENPYDPNMRVDYTGVNYYYETVELRTSAPKPFTA
jgi:hypothetical protein